MRSLPPPRVTRSRRWKRIKRALKFFFTRGYVSDPGAFLTSGTRLVLLIRRSRIFPRFKRVDETLGSSSIMTVGRVGRILTRVSLPLLLPTPKMKLKISSSR